MIYIIDFSENLIIQILAGFLGGIYLTLKIFKSFNLLCEHDWEDTSVYKDDAKVLCITQCKKCKHIKSKVIKL